MTTTNPGEPHQFVISDEDLFFGAEPTTKDVRSVSCYVCGDQPGQGVHKPPPPPLHAVITDKVAQTLASTMAISWDTLRPEAARAAFTTIQQLRTALDAMGKQERYADRYDMGDSFGDIDTELDDVMTKLRKIGWAR
jgi:hypothetical protein